MVEERIKFKSIHNTYELLVVYENNRFFGEIVLLKTFNYEVNQIFHKFDIGHEDEFESNAPSFLDVIIAFRNSDMNEQKKNYLNKLIIKSVLTLIDCRKLNAITISGNKPNNIA